MISLVASVGPRLGINMFPTQKSKFTFESFPVYRDCHIVIRHTKKKL